VVAAKGRGGLRGLLAGALLMAAAAEPGSRALLGFTAESSARQRGVEARLLALPDPARCEAHHRELTRTPHTAGTDGALRVVEYVAARFREYGLETEVVPYDVLLAWPRAVEVELLSPHARTCCPRTRPPAIRRPAGPGMRMQRAAR
jgi:N-acetylated-alpha-linked acidic dipeptidase